MISFDLLDKFNLSDLFNLSDKSVVFFIEIWDWIACETVDDYKAVIICFNGNLLPFFKCDCVSLEVIFWRCIIPSTGICCKGDSIII